VPARSLPLRPSLDQLKIQARELHQEHRDGQPSAAARIAAHHPRFSAQPPQAILEATFALADAQLVVAREYGFESWTKLKHHVELADAVAAFRPHPGFDEAVAAMDAGDADRLRSLLAADRSLVHARTNLEPPYHYFTGATLLHHVAGNPDRGRLDGTRPPLPANSADLARVLLEAGADVNARTLGPNGGDTMGLLVTSKQASDANVAGPLIDVLLKYGARLDLESDGCLDGSLANHAPRAAEKMIELGARPDLLAAAAMGRLDLLEGFFDREGRLLLRPRRHNREMTARDAIGLALLYAYVRHQPEVVDFLLEKDGNWDVIGVNNGAVLHRAAFSGDLAMVQRLVARGADTSNRNNPFCSTPLGWADHNAQAEAVEWMRANCAIDLHDAVSFDFAEHVEARLREDPASVDRRIDHWDVPQGTALHWAASLGRVNAARILLEHGADPNIVAGNGLTPLDMADASGKADVAALLEQHGGTRTVRPTRAKSVMQVGMGARTWTLPLYRIDEHRTLRVRHSLEDRDWDEIIAAMADQGISSLDAAGQMTDAVLGRIVALDRITRLNLGGSKRLTDDGLAHLARLPRLEELDLSEYPGGLITDRGLEMLRHLPELRRFQMCWQSGITDAGVANLKFCDHLESVDLLGTYTGDGAITALAGKRKLRRLKTGRGVTDAALPLLHQLPVFKTWHGGKMKYSLMSADAEPNHLLLDGPFTDSGLAAAAGLDGLFGLSFFWHISAMTAAGLEQLIDLPNLGFLGCEGRLCTDAAMRYIGSIPRLRMLMGQGAVAGDAGFAALSRSRTIEFIWGRECPNLTGRGFASLSAMPALRGLAVSCKYVDDEALSMLPRFPALRELMPMDVPDAGFRHIGRCEELEGLWCMYCRDTTDVATAHIAGLSKLKTYYAGQTRITDRSLEILSRMDSLEKLEFWNCAAITDAGVALLARLPALREVSLDGCRQITPDAAAAFPARVQVSCSV
jgi:ankyrin repeat protein